MRCATHQVDWSNSEQLDAVLEAHGLKYAKGPHPKADPQTLANIEHLNGFLRTRGPDAAVEEFRRMQQGHLPPVEKEHRAMAISYRRWNRLPPLTDVESESSPARVK